MDKEKITSHYLFVILFVVLFWFTTVAISATAPELISFLSSLIFLLSSSIILLIYAARFKTSKTITPFEVDRLTGKERAGLALYGLAVVMEVFFYRSWMTIITENPDTVLRLKYALISFPVATAVSIALFSPLGNGTDRNSRGKAQGLVTIILSALAFGLIMNALHGEADLKLFAVMSCVGALAGFGHWVTRKLYLTLTTLFLVIHANSLATEAFAGMSWILAIAGFIIFGIVLLYLWSQRINRKSITAASC